MEVVSLRQDRIKGDKKSEGISDLKSLFSLFLYETAHRSAHLRLFVLSCLYFIFYPFDFLSPLCGLALIFTK